MKTNIEIIEEVPSTSQPVVKKAYQKPELRLLGDVRGVTLGTSNGRAESDLVGNKGINDPTDL